MNIIKNAEAVAEPLPDLSSVALAETGKQVIQEFINQFTDPTAPGPTVPPDTGRTPQRPNVPPEVAALPVGILGAGVSGLYIAMMLDSLNIKYEILEGSGRTGGRLYTHNFPKNAGKYQYYVSRMSSVYGFLTLFSLCCIGCRSHALSGYFLHEAHF